MNENELTTWFIFTVLPIGIAVAGFVWKLGKDKRDNENRITRIESEIREHRRDIASMELAIERQREEAKIILEVSSKIDTLTTRFDNFENRFYSNQGHAKE
ncbi:DUF7365 family protein [Staphylococcus succinus]